MSQPQSSKESTAPAAKETKEAKDRRSFSRRHSHNTALVRPANQALASAVRVTVLDYSYGGICVMAPVKLNIGDHVLVDMPSSSAANWTVTFEAIIRWVEQDDGGNGYRTGCSWTRQLSYMELQQLR